MYAVFDHTKTTGTVFHTRNERLADTVSIALTEITGRAHGYDLTAAVSHDRDIVISLGASVALCGVVMLACLIANALPV